MTDQDDIRMRSSLTQATAFSKPFTYVYNNFDVVYLEGEKHLTVTYHNNGGSGVFSKAVYFGDYVVLSLDKAGLSHPDSLFTGWNDKADGKGTAYYPGQSVTLLGNFILYAQWQPDDGEP